MAYIVNLRKLGVVHKEGHNCFDKEPFLKGLFGFSPFCQRCGERLTEEGMTTTRRCSVCNSTIILSDFNYCPDCGVRFDESERFVNE